MKLFLKNLLLFLLPVSVFFAPAFAVLWGTGEFYSLDRIGALARTPRPVLAGAAYSNFQTQYQLLETKTRTPSVLALGNSHVNEFRAAFFKEPAVFYNAAHAVLALSDFTHFIGALDTQPKIIIVAMSPSYFNPDNTKVNLIKRPNPFASPIAPHDPMLESFFRNGGWWKLYVDFYYGKFTFEQVFETNSSVSTIGLRSVAEKYGFTNDGSDYYGDVIHSASSQASIREEIENLAKNISETRGYLDRTTFTPYGSTLSEHALKELKTFLHTSKEKNIFVIGYVPPIAQAGYDRMEQYSDAPYAYAFKQLAPTLQEIYREYGFAFYDFTSPASFGGSDGEMLDAGIHFSEKADLRMLIRMAKGTPQLRQFVDVPYLEKSLANAKSPFVVFDILDLH